MKTTLSQQNKHKRAGKITRTLLSALFIAIILLGMTGCFSKGGNEGASSRNVNDEYEVLTITTQSVTVYAEYPVTIQGQEIVEIRPRIDGYMEAIYVDEGASVQKGQSLFQISAPQFEQEVNTAQAEIKIAKAEVHAAEIQVKRLQPLVEKKIISNHELESAEYTLESRQATLAQAEARLANARTNLGYTHITSPVNGVVGLIPFKVGSLVSSSTDQPLTTVANVNNIYAYFSVNEKESIDFTMNTQGATIQERLKVLPPVTLILAEGTEWPHKGKIDAASGLVNTQTGSVSVRAIFPNPNNLIRSGNTGFLKLPTTIHDAILIPQKATFELQGKQLVYVLQDDGTVKSTEIETASSNPKQFYIVTKGLKSGDKIVIEGAASLNSNTKITPIDTDATKVFHALAKQ